MTVQIYRRDVFCSLARGAHPARIILKIVAAGDTLKF